MSKLQAIRGMNDILPEQSLSWQYLESCFQSLVQAYGYREIRFPVLEQTQLFKRSIGELTDIVEILIGDSNDCAHTALRLRCRLLFPKAADGPLKLGTADRPCPSPRSFRRVFTSYIL